MAIFLVWELSDLTQVGSGFSVNTGAIPELVHVVDEDAFLENTDSTQTLESAQTLNGSSYATNSAVFVEDSYAMRPAGGPTDGSQDFTVFLLHVGGDWVGAASTAPLVEGASYTYVGSANTNPSVAYADLHVCFQSGTQISTPQGPQAVECLRIGDVICTRDSGPQPIVWAGLSDVCGIGRAAPIWFGPRAMAALGADSAPPLSVSPQHRMLVRDACGAEVLVPAKALVGWEDVVQRHVSHVRYVHIMVHEHALLTANGVICESFNPGPMALNAFSFINRIKILRMYPHAMTRRVYKDVRPVIGAAKWRRTVAHDRALIAVGSQ